MSIQSQISDYFRIAHKCQYNPNEMSRKCTQQNASSPNQSVSARKRQKNKAPNKKSSKNERQLEIDMQVLPDSDSSSSSIHNTSRGRVVKIPDSSESDDPDKHEFEPKKSRTLKEKTVRRRIPNGKSPGSKGCVRSKKTTPSVKSPGANEVPNVASSSTSKSSSASGKGQSTPAETSTAETSTSKSGLTSSVNIKLSFNNAKATSGTTSVARNLFPEPGEISVQVSFVNESSPVEGTTCRTGDSAESLNRLSNVTTPGTSAGVCDQAPGPVKKSVSSPAKQSTLTQMKFKTSKPKVLGSPDKAKATDDKKENMYNEASHRRLCEKVRTILKWVFANEYFKILFTKKEIDLLNELFGEQNHRQLVICLRLYTRLPKWYNLARLCAELNLELNPSEPQQVLQRMVEQRLVETDYTGVPIEALLDQLARADVKDICTSFKLKYLQTKASMIGRLVEHARQQGTLTSLKRTDHILRDRVNLKLGVCVKLSACVRDTLHRIHLLYSLANAELEGANDIYFLMERLQNETVQYPTGTIEPVRVFQDRTEFLSYEQSLVLQKEFEEQKTKKDVESEYRLCKEAHRRLTDLLANGDQLRTDQEKPLFLRTFSAAWVYCHVLLSGAQSLGRHYVGDVCTWLSDMLDQHVYCARKRGAWYVQLALVQNTHRKDPEAAARTILTGLADKLVTEVSRHELSIRGAKVRKGKLPQLLFDRLQHVLLPACTEPETRRIVATVVHNNQTGRKLHFVSNTPEGREYSSVEHTAITHYTTELGFTDGVHCEGRLLTTLFFVLFWDVVYEHPVPRTFITELQTCPLDLYSGEFYANRAEKIDARLRDLRDIWSLDTIGEFIMHVCSLHQAELKSVHPHDFGDDGVALQTFVRCMGKVVLAAVCERLAKDYTQFRSGLPDLFLWNRKQLKCCFVEVKSERDSLSTNQILWLHYLQRFGARVEVCYVESIGSHIKKKSKT